MTWGKSIWENVFNTDNMFNTFVNTYLQIFYTCFPKKKIYEQSPPKQWLTIRIKTSCKRKRELYLLMKVHDNKNLKQYYKSYSKILTKVINEAKDSATKIKLPSPIILLKPLGILLEQSRVKAA
jgi:hypothetical protein